MQNLLKGERHPKTKLSMFMRYLKTIRTVLKNYNYEHKEAKLSQKLRKGQAVHELLIQIVFLHLLSNNSKTTWSTEIRMSF